MLVSSYGHDQMIDLEIDSDSDVQASGSVWFDSENCCLWVLDETGNKHRLRGPSITAKGSELLWEMYDWYKKQKQKEEELDALCEKYPALKEARDQFNILHRLVNNENV